MKVLLVNVNPEENSLSDSSAEWLKELFAQQGIETQIFRISHAVRGCVACGKCYRAGKCIFDDEVNEAIRLMEGCDALLIGSPVLYGKLDEQTEHFLERLFHAGTSVLARKPAGAVLFSRRRTDSSAFLAAVSYFAMANMPAAAVQSGHVICEEAGSHEVLSAVVSQMTWLMRCLEAGKEMNVDFTDGAPKRTLDYVR